MPPPWRMPPGLDRNVALYPWYATAFRTYFWSPVFMLYFTEHFSLAAALRLEAIYYFAVVLLEVPSGYASDVFGRKRVLVASAALMVASYTLFFIGGPFWVFACAQICLAGGFSFTSGTDTALHYESLAGIGKAETYAEREARVVRNTFRGGAAAALIGGFCAASSLRLAYAASLITAVIALALLLGMVEPERDSPEHEKASPFLRQIIESLGYIRASGLRWLFAFAVVMTVLNHLPYEFFQPYFAQILGDAGGVRSTPVAAGVHVAVSMLIGSWAAGWSVRIQDRIGLGPALLFAAGLQTALICSMALVVHPVVAVLLGLRTCPRALMTAPLNGAVTPRVPADHRATYLSLQSLVGRLGFSGVLLMLSTFTHTPDGATGSEFDTILTMSAIGAVAGLVLLALSCPREFKRTASGG